MRAAAEHLGFRLRARREEDFEPRFQLHKESLGALSSAGGRWDDAERRWRFERWIGTHDVRVIERDAAPIGMVGIESSGGGIYFTDFELLPEFRGRSIGTHLFGAVLDAAGIAGVTVKLHVYERNPARRLFERLGFTPIDDASPFGLLMVWPPPDQSATGTIGAGTPPAHG